MIWDPVSEVGFDLVIDMLPHIKTPMLYVENKGIIKPLQGCAGDFEVGHLAWPVYKEH